MGIKRTVKKCKNNASKKSTTLKKQVRTQKGGGRLLDVIGNTELSREEIYKQVKQILENNNVDVNKAGWFGKTPLYIASEKGYVEVVRMLVKGGVDMNKSSKWDDGATPLIIASQNGHVEVVRALVEGGADMDKANDGGWTPLYVASLHGHVEVVRVLVEAGADKDKVADGGVTPLYIASEEGHVDVVRVLLEHGADITKTFKNITPLMIAERRGHLKVVDILMGQEDNDTEMDIDVDDKRTVPELLANQFNEVNERMHKDATQLEHLKTDIKEDSIYKYTHKRGRENTDESESNNKPEHNLNQVEPSQKKRVKWDTCNNSSIIRKVVNDRGGNNDKGFLAVKQIIQKRLQDQNIDDTEKNVATEGAKILTSSIRSRLRNIKANNKNSQYKDKITQRIAWFKNEACSDLIIKKIFGSGQSYTDYFNSLFRTKDFYNSDLDSYVLKFRTKESGMEMVTAQKQCETAFGYKIKEINKEERCYLCGHYLKKFNDHGIDCEHILPIETALSHISIVQNRYDEIDEYLKLEYKWSHSCCNIAKTDIDVIIQKGNKWEVDIDAIEHILHKIEHSTATRCRTIQNYGNVYTEDNVNKIITIVQPIVDIINTNMENIGENYYRLYLFYKLLSSFSDDFFTQIITGTWGDKNINIRRGMNINGGSNGSELDVLFNPDNDVINNSIQSDIEGLYQELDKQLEENPDVFKPKYIKTTKTEYDENAKQERQVVRFFPHDRYQELIAIAKRSSSIMPEFKPVKTYFSDDDTNIIYEFPTGNNPYGTFDIGAIENIKQSGSGNKSKKTVRKTKKSKKNTRKKK
jgi:ankyrin repeat protein